MSVRIPTSEFERESKRRAIAREISITTDDIESVHESDFLLWRRFHQSKAKLRGVTEMATLLAGFSIVATIELDLPKKMKDEIYETPYLLTAFAVTTATLVSTTMFSILIATCILPHLEAAGKLDSVYFLKQSPHETFMKYIDLAWILANAISIFLFVVDVILLAWIKFEDPIVASAFTIIMGPVLVLLIVFSLIFYRKLLQHQYDHSKRQCDEIDNLFKTMLINRSSFSFDNGRRNSHASF